MGTKGQQATPAPTNYSRCGAVAGKAKEMAARQWLISRDSVTVSYFPASPCRQAGRQGHEREHARLVRQGGLRHQVSKTQRGLWQPRVIAPYLKPSCRQATSVLITVQPSSQTVPHCPPWYTSRRPSWRPLPPASRRAPSATGRRHRN